VIETDRNEDMFAGDSSLRGLVRHVVDRIRRLRDDRSGNIAIVAALSAIPLALAIGVAVDYSRSVAAKTDLQEALDAAVLAGARDGGSGWTTLSSKMLVASVKTKDFTLSASNFALDASGNYVGTASGTVATTFAGLVSMQTIPIAATATAALKPASDKVCVLLLNSLATGLWLNSGANINAPNCQVHVKSIGLPAAIFNSGTTLNTKKTCIQGAIVLDNGGTHPNVSKSCSTVSDPFAGTLPIPSSSSCTYNNYTVNGGSATLSPGVYCGWTNFNSSPNVTLQPGVYVIRSGGWNFSGTLNGTGVTFYFADLSFIQFNSTSTINLSAPTSGTYANLLMYETAGLLKVGATINATNGATLNGLMYLPNRQLTLNSGASATSDNLTMVLDTLMVNTVNWSLDGGAKSIPVAGSTGNAGAYLLK
jgi:Flp pilus assembly protein TadG